MATDLDVSVLRTFVVSVRMGSISRAASALGRTQPALSQQLRRLENLVGRPLLRRSPSGVSLTQAGEILLPYAERILALSSAAVSDVGSGMAVVGRCGIGLIEDLASASLPLALADFARQHPGVALEIVTASGPAMREAFETGRIQLALCDTSYFPQPPLWSVRLKLVWAIGPGVNIRPDPLPLVLFSEPCRWRAAVLDALATSNRRWRIAFESTSLAGVQAAVRGGLGVAALLPDNVGSGMVVLGPGGGLPALPEVGIGLVRRLDTVGDPLIDAVEAVLKRLT